MPRNDQATRFPTRLLMLARDTFEASVAIHYDAPWVRARAPARMRDAKRAA
eukprot:gene1654-1684_t